LIKRTPEIGLPGLAALLARGKAGGLPDQAASYAGYGRFALLNVLKSLGFGPGDRVLLPAYICDVVLLPLGELGIEPVYYGITADFQVDWDSVRLFPGTRALVSVNYFGFSQDYPAISGFATRNGLVWINDNAHGFASCLGERPLEEFGDFSFTSFRKVIGSLNGARVLINNARFASLKGELDRLNGGGAAEPRTRYLLAAALRTTGLRLRGIPDFSDPTGFSEDDPKKYRIDGLALRALALSDEALIRKRRRALYLAVEEFLLARGYGFLTPVPGLLRDGNSPLLFPVVARDREAWLAVLRSSRSQGLDLHSWPSLPAAVLETNSFAAVDLWRRLLFLPLHQDLEAAQYLSLLQRVLDAV
jgi:perosamine synthetase